MGAHFHTSTTTLRVRCHVVGVADPKGVAPRMAAGRRLSIGDDVSSAPLTHVSGVADVGWKPPPRTRALVCGRRGTILFVQECNPHREVLHYLGSKNHRNEFIWHLILRINSLAGKYWCQGRHFVNCQNY